MSSIKFYNIYHQCDLIDSFVKFNHHKNEQTGLVDLHT